MKYQHLASQVTSVTVHLFNYCRAGTTYKVNVFGMFEGGESNPLVGQEMTTLSDTTTEPFLSRGKHDCIQQNVVLAFG